MRTLASLFFAGVVATTGVLVGCGGSVDSTGTGSDGTGSPSSTPSPGGSSDSTKTGGSTSGSPAPYGSGCTYPKIDNPPECPPAYTRQPPPSCSSVGLKCWYPGVGDGDGKGCWSTALLACQGNAKADPDGGSDGGLTTGHWVGAQ